MMARAACVLSAWFAVFLLPTIAATVPAGRSSAPPTATDEGFLKEFTFYHEALRLIEQESNQLRTGTSVGRLQVDRSSMEGRISIKVEPLDIVLIPGYRLYRAYNNQIDPAWIYKIALGQRGEIYRLGGFTANDFTKMILPALRDASDTALLRAVAAYYQLVEDYDPGVLQTIEDVRRAKEALMASSALSAGERQRVAAVISPPIIEPLNAAHRVTVYIFDRRSMRTERSVVRASSIEGLVIEKRDVVLDKYRIAY